jgi:hypothetical protein
VFSKRYKVYIFHLMLLKLASSVICNVATIVCEYCQLNHSTTMRHFDAQWCS